MRSTLLRPACSKNLVRESEQYQLLPEARSACRVEPRAAVSTFEQVYGPFNHATIHKREGHRGHYHARRSSDLTAALPAGAQFLNVIESVSRIRRRHALNGRIHFAAWHSRQRRSTSSPAGGRSLTKSTPRPAYNEHSSTLPSSCRS